MPEPATIVKNLLRWFQKEARDLPWRREADPYGIWISEIMLQQTQVKTVIPYWERWMEQLPTVEHLAEAAEDTVLKLWEGLGYYSRARNIHRAARVILDSHEGEFPRDYDSILGLPGIGPYTAGAISSIAYGDPQPIVDGNVIRVLTRVDGIRESTKLGATKAQLWKRAEELVREAAKVKSSKRNVCGDFNQSLMELGALICLPRQAECLRCPLRRACVGRREDLLASVPNVGERKKAVSRLFMAVVVKKGHRFMVRQRDANSVNGGLWEFPNSELTSEDSAGVGWLKNALGIEPSSLRLLEKIKHSITTNRILLQAYVVDVSSGYRAPVSSVQWVSREKLNDLAFTAAHRKIVDQISD